MSDIFPQPKSIDSTLSDVLRHYVYLLVDPRDGKVFYVGKGVSDRCLQHDHPDDGAEKAARIADIKSAGLETKVEIIRHGMATGDEAYLVEGAIIDLLGVDNLTNIVRGHGAIDFGRATLGELAARYAPEEAEIRHRVVFVKLAKTFKKGMSAQELYEASRGVWNLSPVTARDYHYVLALWEGLVVEVYRVGRWQPAHPCHYPTRVLKPEDFIPEPGVLCTEFDGEVASDDIRQQYLGKSVRKYFSSGGQVGCQYGPDVKAAR